MRASGLRLVSKLLGKIRRRIATARAKKMYKEEFARFKSLASNAGITMPMPWERRWPILNERTATTEFEPHYTYFPAWASRAVREIAPRKHVDISSTLHFCTIISAFVPVEFYDFRPANLLLSDLTTGSCDLTSLSFASGSIESLSCLHVIEHIGLGRYGDPIDPTGDMKAARELSRVIAPGGSLLLAVPIGRPLIQFNAHRIYSYHQIISAFPGLKLKHLALIPDNAVKTGMIQDATAEECDRQEHGCGCFWFTRPA